MTLLSPGFFPSTYWPENYFNDDYWPEFALTDLGTINDPSITAASVARTMSNVSTAYTITVTGTGYTIEVTNE